MKNLLCVLAGFIGIMLVSPALTTIHAKELQSCESATITRAGIHSLSKKYPRIIYADCDSNSAWSGERMFFIHKRQANEMYAAALTAIATGYKVELAMSDFSEGSLVHVIVISVE